MKISARRRADSNEFETQATASPIPETPSTRVERDLLVAMDNCPWAVYHLLLEAIDQLGGELRLSPDKYESLKKTRPPRISIDLLDGPVVLSRSAELHR